MTYKRTITKFNRGAVDENFMARDDVERVVDTCADLKNMLPIRLGPAMYRPGTEWLEYTWSGASERMIPFLVSGNRSVMLEFAQSAANPSIEHFRIWVDGALLTRTGTADVITNGEFTTDLTGWTDGSDAGGAVAWDAANGGSVKITGNGTGDYGRLSQDLTVTVDTKRTLRIAVGAPQVEILIGTAGVDSGDIISGVFRRGYHSLTFTPEASPVTITLRSDKKYAVYVDAVSYEAAGEFNFNGSILFDTSGAGRVLDSLRTTQSADVMFMVSNGYELEGRGHPLWMVERRGDESWSIVIPEFQDGPFGLINTTKLTLTPSAVDGDITLTASLPLFTDSTWVGRSYKLVHGADEGICVITSVTNTTTALARVVREFGAATATDLWYPGRFSYYQTSPTAVAIFDGRLWLGGDGKIDGSVSDAYLSFDGSIEGDSKAIAKTIGFGPVQQVYWMSAGEELLVGTGSAELKVGSNDFGDTITQANCRIRPISHIGSAAIEPVRIDGLIYFVQRAGKRIMELREAGSGLERILPRDVQLLHPNVCGSGIVRLAVTRNPEMRLWIVNADGNAAVCLLDATESVNGWSTIEMAGADLLDIAVLPDTEEDEVYVHVSREYEPEYPYMERFAPSTEATGGTISRHYDGHVFIALPGTSTDLAYHLTGQPVYVWVNGKEHGPYEVDGSGFITLPANTWEDVVVGVRHHGHYLTNRLAHYIPQSVVNDRKRVTAVGVVLRNAVLKTITYGDGLYCGYPLPLAEGPPSSDPNIIGSFTGTVGAGGGLGTDGEHIFISEGDPGYGLFTWGNNASGQLALGHTTLRNSPTLVASSGYATAVMGDACLRAKKIDGTWWTAGFNDQGNLGVGDTTNRSVLTQIPGSYETMARGGGPSAIGTDGKLYTWGKSGADGGAQGRSFVTWTFQPDGITPISGGGSPDTTDALVPTLAGNMKGAYDVQIEAQGLFTTLGGRGPTLVAGRSNGTAWAICSQYVGSGLGGFVWVPLDPSPPTYWSVCTLGDGSSSSGDTFRRFDTGISPPVIAPAGPADPADANWTGAKFEIAGDGKAGVILRADNTVWLWGTFGALWSSKYLPEQLAGSWQDISLGGSHVMLVGTDGKLWTWGAGTNGQLGVGTTASHLASPIQVGAQTDWTRVSAGRIHSLGMRSGGRLFAWGNNSFGQLGLSLGTSTQRSSPSQISGTWQDFCAQWDSSVGLR